MLIDLKLGKDQPHAHELLKFVSHAIDKHSDDKALKPEGGGVVMLSGEKDIDRDTLGQLENRSLENGFPVLRAIEGEYPIVRLSRGHTPFQVAGYPVATLTLALLAAGKALTDLIKLMEKSAPDAADECVASIQHILQVNQDRNA